MNKIIEQEETSPNKIAINFKRQANLPLRNCQKVTIIDIRRNGPKILPLGGDKRNNGDYPVTRESPETRRLVERQVEIDRPGTMRRRYDGNAQRTIWVPSWPNKRSREEIAEIDDGVLRQRANRLGEAIS